MGANKASGDGGSKDHRTQKGKEPKKKTNIIKSAVDKTVDVGKNLITARRKTAYNVAKVIPGSEKSLRKNRTDYRNYLASQGSTTPDFLKDDKNLTSFETYDKLISYKPGKTKSSSDTVTSPLSYADYLAEEKGNYNLKMAGNVGGINNPERGRDNNNQQIKPVILDTAPTTAEVSQSEAATAAAAEDSLILRKRRAKAKGRSPTIMTGVTGVDGSLTLGKPSLLGS
jgi:hypothetical protein